MNNLSKCIVFLFLLFDFIFIPSLLFAQSGKNGADSIAALVQKLSSDTDKVNTLLDLSRGVDCDDSTKKLAVATEAKRIAEKINWGKGIMNANRYLGDIYFKCHRNYPKAFEFYEKNIAYLKNSGDIPAMAKAFETLAKQYDRLHDHQKSIHYYYQILELNPGAAISATVYNNIGISFKAIGDNLNALKCYDTSLQLLRSKKVKDAQDTFEMAGLYLNEGDIYVITGQPDKALEIYNWVESSGAALHDKQFLIWSLEGKGKAHKFIGRSIKDDIKAKEFHYDEAKKKYQEELRICREINAFEDEVNADVELAKIYMETGELDKALSYADSALSLAGTQRYTNLLSKCNATLGNIYLAQNNYELSISYLQKAAEIAEQSANLEDKLEALGGLKVAYRKNGQFEKALEATNQYDIIKENIFSVNVLNTITRNALTEEFKNKSKIDSLQRDAVYGKKIATQRVLTYSGFTALVLVLLLAFFAFRNYQTQKKYNALLSKEKTQHLAHIEAQSNVLSEISHIQAHQVRGPISTILGLVNIFNYDDPADPINKQVMEWIASTTEKLDVVVKDVIIKENELRNEHGTEESTNA